MVENNDRFSLRVFLGQPELRGNFDRVRAWFDQDFERQEHYTVGIAVKSSCVGRCVKRVMWQKSYVKGQCRLSVQNVAKEMHRKCKYLSPLGNIQLCIRNLHAVFRVHCCHFR